MNHEIQKLRQDGLLKAMAGGQLGVPISVQYLGNIPALARPARKDWLLNHFQSLGVEMVHLPFSLDTNSISVSGQTVDALCDADEFEHVRDVLEAGEHRVTIQRPHRVTNS